MRCPRLHDDVKPTHVLPVPERPKKRVTSSFSVPKLAEECNES